MENLKKRENSWVNVCVYKFEGYLEKIYAKLN